MYYHYQPLRTSQTSALAVARLPGMMPAGRSTWGSVSLSLSGVRWRPARAVAHCGWPPVLARQRQAVCLIWPGASLSTGSRARARASQPRPCDVTLSQPDELSQKGGLGNFMGEYFIDLCCKLAACVRVLPAHVPTPRGSNAHTAKVMSDAGAGCVAKT